MIENSLNNKFDNLMQLIPAGWEKVILFSQIEKLHYNIFFYVKFKDKYIQCYNLETLCGTTEKEIDEFAEDWYRALIEEKKDEKWVYCTASINADYSFMVDYSYEDDFDLISWKKKYLV